MPVNMGDFLRRRARINPNKEAVFEPYTNTRTSFEELNKRINKTTHAFQQIGLSKGDRVGNLLMNGLPLIESILANAKLGSINVALNWRLTADELEFILKDSGTKALLFGEEFCEIAKELHARGDATKIQSWVQVGGTPLEFATSYKELVESQSTEEPEVTAYDDDLLFIMYTSGTTGLPKGVMHSHNTVVWASINLRESLPFSWDERFLISLPLFHVGALLPLFTNVYCGFPSIITRTFDPQESWQLITEEKINSTLLVPAMLLAMKACFDPARHDASSLTNLMSGAAPVPVSLIKDYKEMGVSVNQVYGMTETGGPGCAIVGEDAIQRPGSTGRSSFHTDLRVVDKKGNDCPVNMAGEVILRAPNHMLGYWNRPDATEETIIDGWLYTGDVATMDEDGFVTIVERIKDMIISGGENIYPAEIENALLSHPGVADVAVIGIHSERWGECVMATVVKQDNDLTEEDVIAHSKAKLAAFKSVKTVRFVDSIPRNPSGKILKRDLREQFADVVAPE